MTTMPVTPAPAFTPIGSYSPTAPPPVMQEALPFPPLTAMIAPLQEAMMALRSLSLQKRVSVYLAPEIEDPRKYLWWVYHPKTRTLWTIEAWIGRYIEQHTKPPQPVDDRPLVRHPLREVDVATM